MNTEHFKYLQTLAQCHSIRQAAEQLHIKQSNLSIILKNTETYYGIIIFNRNHKGISLTKDGEFFMKQVNKMIDLLQIIESPYLYPSKQKYSTVIKDINIYVQDTATSKNFMAITNNFHEHFPYVKIHLSVKEQNKILQLAQEDNEAIGLIYTTDEPYFFDMLMEKTLSAVPYAVGRAFAITGKQNKKAQHLTSISIHDILKKDLVLYSIGDIKENIPYQWLHTYGTPHIKYIVDNSLFFSELLQENDYWSLGKIDSGMENTLIAIPFQEDIIMHSYFVYNSEAANSFIIKSFIKIAKNLSNRFSNQYIVK